MHYYKSTIMQIYGIQIDAPHIYFTYGKTVAYKAENLSIGHLCLFTDHIYTLTLSYRVTNVHRRHLHAKLHNWHNNHSNPNNNDNCKISIRYISTRKN